MSVHHAIDANQARATSASWRRATAVTTVLGVLALALLSGPGAAARPDEPATETPALEVVYPDGALELAEVVPGTTRVGRAEIINHTREDLAVEASGDWARGGIVAEAVSLNAQVCTDPWQGGDCPGTAVSIPVQEEPTSLGVLEGEKTWYVRVDARLPADADNTTQDLSAPLTIQLAATSEDEGGPGAGPGKGKLPETGTGTASLGLIVLTLLLTAVGGVLVGLRLARARVRRRRPKHLWRPRPPEMDVESARLRRGGS